MVWLPGFEPGTSCSRSKRATKLRYSQIKVQKISNYCLVFFNYNINQIFSKDCLLKEGLRIQIIEVK